MAEETPPPVQTPPPPPKAPPAWLVFLVNLLPDGLWKTILLALLGVASGVYLAKNVLPAVPSIPSLPGLPHILPKPKRCEDAIGKIIFGNAGCTATIIGPVWSNDPTLDILTAAHCVKIGAAGKMFLKDGRTLVVKCVSRDANSDAAWLSADNPGGDIPYVLLADDIPNDGEIVWHQGFGIDKPGNRESGIFRGTRRDAAQCQFRLSVSPGDSGGGIILDSQSRVISPVCCTTRLSGLGDVFGASPLAAAKIRPAKGYTVDEPTLIYPVLPLPDDLESALPSISRGGK